MPKYRQLHVKVIDSFDFNEMPDDFTRVVWLLLIVIVDSEGRGIDNMAWVRSKMFPLRTDVSVERLEQSFCWMAQREMIVRYDVGGKRYFYLSKFKNYQTGLTKEAPSSYPPCTDKEQNYSRPTPDLLQSNSGASLGQYNTKQYSTDDDFSLDGKIRELSDAFTHKTNIQMYRNDEWIKAFRELFAAGITAHGVHDAVDKLTAGGMTISGPWSIVKTAVGMKNGNGNNGNRGKKPLVVLDD